MFPDGVRIPDFHIDSLVIPDVAETHCVPLRWERVSGESLVKSLMSFKRKLHCDILQVQMHLKDITTTDVTVW